MQSNLVPVLSGVFQQRIVSHVVSVALRQFLSSEEHRRVHLSQNQVTSDGTIWKALAMLPRARCLFLGTSGCDVLFSRIIITQRDIRQSWLYPRSFLMILV